MAQSSQLLSYNDLQVLQLCSDDVKVRRVLYHFDRLVDNTICDDWFLFRWRKFFSYDQMHDLNKNHCFYYALNGTVYKDNTGKVYRFYQILLSSQREGWFECLVACLEDTDQHALANMLRNEPFEIEPSTGIPSEDEEVEEEEVDEELLEDEDLPNESWNTGEPDSEEAGPSFIEHFNFSSPSGYLHETEEERSSSPSPSVESVHGSVGEGERSTGSSFHDYDEDGGPSPSHSQSFHELEEERTLSPGLTDNSQGLGESDPSPTSYNDEFTSEMEENGDSATESFEAIEELEQGISFELTPTTPGSNGVISQRQSEDAYTVTDISDERTVGQLTFSPSQILGKGCEGTFVYKGRYDGRNVAVKRVLSNCVTIAEKELEILRIADQHENIVRYFCTEKDEDFTYIALQLCTATLGDWVGGKYVNGNVHDMTVLEQATKGVAYLHQMKIVHRDMTPGNILLSEIPGSEGEVNALISDFGFSKRVEVGRESYSNKTGILGTDGWIAPEVLRKWVQGYNGNLTYAVDIFALGCIYYFVLTKGEHIFGTTEHRRYNVLNGNRNFSMLKEDQKGIVQLIRTMVEVEPYNRPALEAVLRHPIFWSDRKILDFFVEVSNWTEGKCANDNPILNQYEGGGWLVVGSDWLYRVCPVVQMELKRCREYKGSSVRHLLRAVRNSSCHYHKFSEAIQAAFGRKPGGFVSYWMNRFPSLLPYTWESFRELRSESEEEDFSEFYH